jgi:hypothetical protein
MHFSETAPGWSALAAGLTSFKERGNSLQKTSARNGCNFMREEPDPMGQFAISDDSFTLEEQIKSLGDDELLDFWEETQHLTRVMAAGQDFPGDLPGDETMHPEYERLILQELQVRSSRGELR